MSDFPGSFDGVAANTVFCAWTGSNAMSDQRIAALWSILNNLRCPVAFLNPYTLRHWELPAAPFHPAFDLLSATHRADYLRCYLMHHFGGGYTDLKASSTSWWPFFARLRASPALALGYTEVGPSGVAPVPGPMGDVLRANHAALLGVCAFIFRRQTPLTSAWYQETVRRLDAKWEALQRHPARHPQDQWGARFDDGSVSEYPFAWTELLGDIFHPLMYEYRDQLLHDDIAPQFHGYR